MNAKQEYLKNPAKIALGMLALLFLGAVVFFRERTFTDAAFVVVHIINKGDLQIQYERYGSFITQLFPLIALKLHLSLKTILLVYSASFHLFYFSVALFIFFRFKDYPLVILMGFYYSLHVTQTYFWTADELHQGVSWMFLMVGTMKYMAERMKERPSILRGGLAFILFCMLAFLSIFSHPAMIFSFLFLWVYYWIEGQAPFNTKWAFIYFPVIIALFILKMSFSANNSYDQSVSEHLRSLGLSDILKAFVSGTADIFWKSISTKNWLLPLLFIVSLIVLIKKKKYLLVAYLLVANVGYFVLLCLTFTLDVEFYIETQFMPMSIFGATAFVYYVLPEMRSTQKVSWFLAGVFAIRTCFILYAGQLFIARVDKIKEVMRFMKNEHINKMVLLKEDERFEKESLTTAWGVTYESLLQSGLDGDSVTLNFICLSKDDLNKIVSNNPSRDILTPWSAVPKEDWNNKYFHTDTLQPYAIKTYAEVF